jgi:cell division protein FtsX
VTRNKALTDRAAKLDADIVALRDKIEKAGPVLEANAQGSALARLFDMPDTKAATLSTYQNLAMAMVIEFLIVISLVASEVI